MLAIYKKAFVCAWQFKWFYLLLAVIFTAVTEFLPKSNTGLSIGYALFLMGLHRYFLLGADLNGFGMNRSDGAKPRFGGFLWVGFLLAFLAIGIILIPLFAMPNSSVMQFAKKSPDMVILLVLLAYWPVLSLFGSALPASAVQEPYGFALTFKRSIRSAWPTAWRLLVGPGLLGTAMLVAFLVGAVAIVWATGVTKQSVTENPQLAQAIGFATTFMIQLGVMLCSTMGVVVLCDVYQGLKAQESGLVGPAK